MQEREDFEACAKKLAALTDPTRLRILVALLESRAELTVSHLASVAGVPITMASHHLSVLLDAKIVWYRRSGRFVYYSLAYGIVREGGNSLNLGCCSVSFEPLTASGQGDAPTNGTQAD